VLTEPKRAFWGAMRTCARSRAHVSVPCLRKDFTVDDYMLYEARSPSALPPCSSFAALLGDGQSPEIYGHVADSLGLSALTLKHTTRTEVRMAVNGQAPALSGSTTGISAISPSVCRTAHFSVRPRSSGYSLRCRKRDLHPVRRRTAMRGIGAECRARRRSPDAGV
jgi:indole-3-glycerol phosphate synthase